MLHCTFSCCYCCWLYKQFLVCHIVTSSLFLPDMSYIGYPFRCLDTLVYAQSEWLSQLLFSDLKEFEFYHSISFCSCNIYWMEGIKNPFVGVLHCTIRFLFVDQNTLFLALYRSNSGFIFLWLCHHSVTRWLAGNTVWWEIFVRPGSAFHFCVDNFHSSCCTS